MRPDTAQKQSPIVAYAQVPVREYPELTDSPQCKRSPRVNSTEFPTKASDEMNSAIRRQKGTAGVDYWPHHSSTFSQPRHAKRATVQNVFFPALGMRRLSLGKDDRILKAHPDGTNLNSGVFEYTRVRATSDMTPPNAGTRTDHKTSTQVKREAVSDPGSLDSGEFDTHSDKSSQLAYFYQLYGAKFRYMDCIEQHTIDRSNENYMPPKQANGYDDVERPQTVSHPQKSTKVIHGTRTMSVPSMVPPRRGGQEVKVTGHNTVSVAAPSHRRHEHGLLMEVPSRKAPTRHILGDTANTQMRRMSGKDLAIRGTVFALNHSTSKNRASPLRSHHGHSHPVAHGSYNGIFHEVSSSHHRAVRSISIPRAHLSGSALDPSERSRKRTVHFSRSNKVYEYKPSDPVKH